MEIIWHSYFSKGAPLFLYCVTGLTKKIKYGLYLCIANLASCVKPLKRDSQDCWFIVSRNAWSLTVSCSLGCYSKCGCSNPFPANYNFALELCDNLQSLYYVVVKLCLFSKYFQSTYFVPDFVLGVRDPCCHVLYKQECDTITLQLTLFN